MIEKTEKRDPVKKNETQERNRSTLVYVADPMCPWCWGFSSTMNEIMQSYGDRFAFRYVAGGLRTGERVAPVTLESLEYVRDHWECAMLESGQPFDLDFVEAMDFPYDTEPGCRAVVTVRRLYPGREFEFEKRLQKSFYVGRQNPLSMETFQAVLRGMGLPWESFGSHYSSPDVERELRNDFQIASALKRKILPTLYLDGGAEGESIVLAGGFTKREKTLAKLEELLSENSTEESDRASSRAGAGDSELRRNTVGRPDGVTDATRGAEVQSQGEEKACSIDGEGCC